LLWEELGQSIYLRSLAHAVLPKARFGILTTHPTSFLKSSTRTSYLSSAAKVSLLVTSTEPILSTKFETRATAGEILPFNPWPKNHGYWDPASYRGMRDTEWTASALGDAGRSSGRCASALHISARTTYIAIDLWHMCLHQAIRIRDERQCRRKSLRGGETRSTIKQASR
jgi:hypothetical protein